MLYSILALCFDHQGEVGRQVIADHHLHLVLWQGLDPWDENLRHKYIGTIIKNPDIGFF
jgi:hypothetical protein